jgi:hypothetical protein
MKHLSRLAIAVVGLMGFMEMSLGLLSLMLAFREPSGSLLDRIVYAPLMALTMFILAGLSFCVCFWWNE